MTAGVRTGNFSDGAVRMAMPGLWKLQRQVMPEATLVLDWWHVAMRFEHALQAARGLGCEYARGPPSQAMRFCDLHMRSGCSGTVVSSSCLERLTKLAGCSAPSHVLAIRTARSRANSPSGEAERIPSVQSLRAGELWCRRHARLPISTAFVESAVNEIVSKRMIKKQQMRWNRWTVQPFLDVRTAVLNGTLQGSFKRRYPAFRMGNDNHFAQLSDETPHDLACSLLRVSAPARIAGRIGYVLARPQGPPAGHDCSRVPSASSGSRNAARSPMSRSNASGAARSRSRRRNARHCPPFSSTKASERPVGTSAGKSVRRRSKVRRIASPSPASVKLNVCEISQRS